MSLSMAGRIGRYLTKGLKNPAGKLDYGQLASRLGLDMAYGGLAAAQTPGDLGDKLIAFGGTALPGTLGGLSLGGLAKNPYGLKANLLDQVGSVAADFAAYPATEELMRIKDKLGGGKGQSPYERMGEQEQAIIAERIRRQIMAQYGLLPGTREQYAGMG